MKISVNGKEKVIDQESITVARLLTVSKVENPEVVTVQVNGEFVSNQQAVTKDLKNGDSVDFLYFMGGGTFKLLKVNAKNLERKMNGKHK